MLSARASSFRQLSRPGCKTLAARDSAERVQRRVRAACTQPAPSDRDGDERAEDAPPLWQEPQPSPEAELLRHRDGETIRRLVAALPSVFRETIVLRDINNLSYRDIAEVAGVPVGTVMSRLARARTMLRAAWNVEEGAAS